MSICKIPGCLDKTHARGLCSRHYNIEYRANRDSSYDKPVRKQRKIVEYDDYVEITMYKFDGSERFVTKMDKEDLPIIEGKHIHLGGIGYAQIYKGKKKYYIHRIVINAEKHVDHINRDRLDNRKRNLREATGSQNQYNTGVPTSNTTGFKGVHTVNKKFRARIKVDKKEIHLGTFNSKIVAAAAYNRAAKKYHKEFACLNTFE